MKEVDFKVFSNVMIAPGTWKMVLEGDTSAITGSGQFVNISIPGLFLRRPISVHDVDDTSLTIVFKVVGKGTAVLRGLRRGDTVNALTGLGNCFDIDACSAKALLLGGGAGAAPLFCLAKELLAQGKAVTVILGFNKAEEMMLVDDFESLGADVRIATMDGSAGIKGFVTDVLRLNSFSYDYFYGCGPLPMLKAVCKDIHSNGEVSLEERMGCGFGICYGCSCHTTDGPRRVCADGPVFKKEKLIW